MQKDGILTMEEIRERYAGEWVLIECVELDEDLQVVRGRVLAHSSSDEEIFQKLREWRDQEMPIALEYLGQIPEDVVVIV
ncbi:MAG: hypothetical protein N2556_03380 [Anaerolineae bacterium]|nr:hypothetical protein [Anaerolineae bacterium]